MRRGFTLIEVLIALVVFAFGMLALASTTAVAARDLGRANRYARARMLARNRIERLRSNPCPPAGAGASRTPGGLLEFWSIQSAGRQRIISDSVELTLSGRTGHVVLRTIALCAP